MSKKEPARRDEYTMHPVRYGYILYCTYTLARVCILYSVTNDKRVKPFPPNLFLFAGFRFLVDLCYFQRLMIKGRPVDKVKLMSLFSFGTYVCESGQSSVFLCVRDMLEGAAEKPQKKGKFDAPRFVFHPFKSFIVIIRLYFAFAFIPCDTAIHMTTEAIEGDFALLSNIVL